MENEKIETPAVEEETVEVVDNTVVEEEVLEPVEETTEEIPAEAAAEEGASAGILHRTCPAKSDPRKVRIPIRKHPSPLRQTRTFPHKVSPNKPLRNLCPDRLPTYKASPRMAQSCSWPN